jgi:hypothetical protein
MTLKFLGLQGASYIYVCMYDSRLSVKLFTKLLKIRNFSSCAWIKTHNLRISSPSVSSSPPCLPDSVQLSTHTAHHRPAHQNSCTGPHQTQTDWHVCHWDSCEVTSDWLLAWVKWDGGVLWVNGDKSKLKLYRTVIGARGGVVVEALRYKLEGRGFGSRWCHWILSLT